MMSKIKKPRLCEVLGVEPGEEFHLAGYEGPVSIDPDGYLNVPWKTLFFALLCLFEAIENPEYVIRG